MPYKHLNGCTCMTLPEFLNAEGKQEGKTGGQIFNEIIDDMNDDDRKQEKYWKENPQELLKCLLEDYQYILEDNPKEPVPVEIVKVIDVKCSTGFSKDHLESVLHIRCKDEKIREAKYWKTHWSGSFYEPPEEDFNVEWIKIVKIS